MSDEPKMIENTLAEDRFATSINTWLCDECDQVHIGFYYHGEPIALATPDDPLAFVCDVLLRMNEALERSGARIQYALIKAEGHAPPQPPGLVQ